MNMSGSTSSLPAIDQRPFGLQTQRANTTQEARPLPILYGKQRLGVTFISDVFDVLASPVTQQVGKQSETVGNNYYASIAAAVCHGPVDGVYDLFLNGEPVFTSNTYLYAVSLTSAGTSGETFYTATFQTANPHGLATGDVVVIIGADQPAYNGEFTITVVSPTQFQYQIAPTDATTATSYEYGAISAQVRLDPILRDEDNPDEATFTLPDYGTVTIHWGTETQAADSYLNTTSGVVHPPYSGICYIVFQQLWCGYNQTNLPNIEIVLSRAPLPDWASLESGAINGEANPGYIIADMFQNNRNGLMLSDTQIDTDGLDAAASNWNDEGLGVSKPLDRAQDLRSILISLCETIDAMPILNASGLLSILPIRPPDSLDGILTLADANLTSLPQFTPADWTTTYSVTYATFSNAELDWQDDMCVWRDQGQLNVIRNPDWLILDRKWITSATIAQAIADAAGQAAAIPLVSGKITLRYSDTLYGQLSPGSVFMINFSLRPAENLIFRVTERTIAGPDQPELQIEFQADRTYLYTALIDALGGGGEGEGHEEERPTVPAPVANPVNTRLMLFELPPALCPGAPAIAALVARSAPSQTNFSLWLNKNYAWSGAAPASYISLGAKTRFAMHGFLQDDYPAATQLIDTQVEMLVEFDGPDTSLSPITAYEALTNTALIFVDDEIMSLAGWTVVAPGIYWLSLIRGRFGTPIEDHASGARVMLINQADLAVISSAAFQPDNCAQIKITLGAQSSGDVDALNVKLAGNAWRVPPPAAIAVNGTAFNPAFLGGAVDLTISWVLPDPGGVLPAFYKCKVFTRLEIFLGPTADRSNITADSTNVTADGGALNLDPQPLTADNVDITVDTVTVTTDGAELDMLSMKKIYSADVEWPATSTTFNFAGVTGAQDQNFVLRVSTIVALDWKQICSATSIALEVFKFP